VSGRVIVVGSVNVDLVVRGERLPEPGETVIGGTYARFHGGKGGNKAVAAARLGADVTVVAALGVDGFGDDAVAALEAQGVGVGAIVRLEDTPTGVALILVDAAGENLIAVASGANGALTVDHVNAALRALGPRPGDVSSRITRSRSRRSARRSGSGGREAR
jgi:ribokinase